MMVGEKSLAHHPSASRSNVRLLHGCSPSTSRNLERNVSPQQFLLPLLASWACRTVYHASAEFQRVNVITLDGLLAVTIVLLIGALCFKDVFKIIRKLE